jgi:hypothetical protein
MLTKGNNCASYLCDNDSDGRDRLCSPCRAGERLVLGVNAAVKRFLEDTYPMPRVPGGDRSVSALFSPDNPVRREIFEATSVMAPGLVRLLELAIGKRVFMTCGAWVDPFDGWYGGFGWDISEHQYDID